MTGHFHHDGPVLYGLLGGLAIALLVGAVTDLRRREIDNWLTGLIALTAPLFWWSWGLGWADVGVQLAVATISFAVLFGLFALRQMGGGDVKLLTALALWINPWSYLHLVYLMALLGGVLTAILLVEHSARRRPGRIKVPYGVAISLAGLWILALDYLPLLQSGGPTG
jgi:prepilin peptidase CpaA